MDTSVELPDLEEVEAALADEDPVLNTLESVQLTLQVLLERPQPAWLQKVLLRDLKGVQELLAEYEDQWVH